MQSAQISRMAADHERERWRVIVNPHFVSHDRFHIIRLVSAQDGL